MDGDSGFCKTICSICFEDLKPIVEDLQAISICGHVFHELCLQQWFEYCSNAKNTTCPVCKQICTQKSVGRLYFQSIGDVTDLILSQKLFEKGGEENPETLRREVRKLEGKLLGFNSAFERQQKDLNELNEQLCICKEQAKKEAMLKFEALQQKTSMQQLLHSKSEELVRSSSECSRLQERSIALAKELAALKLVSDLNLEEDEVLKLASFGNGANSKDTVDILKKSLVLRNKSYKELMAQCNLLGRGETRSLKKLEKAKERIKKLKTTVQELEMALEVKDNEVLRALKASKKTSKQIDLNGVKGNSNLLHINKHSFEDQMEQLSVPVMNNLVQTGSLTNDPFLFRKTDNSKYCKDLGVNTFKDNTCTINLDQEKDTCFLANASEISTAVHEHSNPVFKPQTQAHFSEDVAVLNSSISRPGASSDTNREALMHGQSSRVGLSGSKTGTKNDKGNAYAAAMDEDLMVLVDDITEVQPLLQIRKETPFPVPIAQPGDQCFSAGLLGPDGANRHLGKWCKRVHDKGSVASSMPKQGSSTGTGDLIAVGADGRGGRIKVLRSQNLSSLDGERSSVWPKRGKYGIKSSGQQSQGCLQIEHFFGKASQ